QRHRKNGLIGELEFRKRLEKKKRACRLFEQTTSPDYQKGELAPMAATQTVPQHLQHCNFTEIKPRRGVVTLFGFGASVRVDRGHLILEDGLGARRRLGRFARVRHGIKRVVAIGSDGFVSLAALRWLADQNAAFVMLERNGKVLATTGPISPS